MEIFLFLTDDEIKSIKHELRKAAKRERAASPRRPLKIDILRPVCPHCQSPHVVRHGRRKDGTQRYLCRDCQRSFAEQRDIK